MFVSRLGARKFPRITDQQSDVCTMLRALPNTPSAELYCLAVLCSNSPSSNQSGYAAPIHRCLPELAELSRRSASCRLTVIDGSTFVPDRIQHLTAGCWSGCEHRCAAGAIWRMARSLSDCVDVAVVPFSSRVSRSAPMDFLL